MVYESDETLCTAGEHQPWLLFLLTLQTVQRTSRSNTSLNNLALQDRGAFILEQSTGIARSIYFQLLSVLSEWYSIDPWKWAHCVFAYSHITPSTLTYTHAHSHSRLGGWEDGYAPEWQPYHWVLSLQGQWAPVPGKASFFSTYLCMSCHCDTESTETTQD